MDFIRRKLESCKKFPVSVECEDYPDVVFELILNARPTQEQVDYVTRVLEKFVENYNRIHFINSIHYISCDNDSFENSHPRGIYIYVDFGRVFPTVLIKMLKVIEKLDLPIYRVAIV